MRKYVNYGQKKFYNISPWPLGGSVLRFWPCSGVVEPGNTTFYLLFDWFGISCMTTDNFCFNLQNRLIQTSQTGGQWYSDTSHFSIPRVEHTTRNPKMEGLNSATRTGGLYYHNYPSPGACLSIRLIRLPFFNDGGPEIPRQVAAHNISALFES